MVEDERPADVPADLSAEKIRQEDVRI